jgi:TonB-linked SusC/RagA family outer membrane protein
MKRILLLSFAFLTVVAFSAMAQRTVSGKVTDDSGESLPGVNVVIKGTTTGTTTDLDGNYRLSVDEGATLVFSFVGFESQEIAVGARTTIDLSMSGVTELQEVVVTAVGIETNRASLGYSVQNVKADDIRSSQETNLVNALNGKVAGVTVVSSSGSPGASSNIRIRGNTSISGSNSPLFVIDGIPIDNSEYGGGTDGVSRSNRAIDINPNDIASLTVLKGAAATVLYGMRASNGAVIITTKKGEIGAPTISVTSSVRMDQVNKLPELQKTYAQGRNVGGVAGYRGPETSEGNSWGPALSTLEFDGATDYPFDKNGRLVPVGTGNGKAAIGYDNYDNFFVNGFTYDNSVSVSGGTEAAKYYFSVGNLQQSGVIPKSNWGRTSVKVSTTSELTDKLSVSLSATYMNSGGQRVQQGSNTSGIMLGLLRTTPTFDNANGHTNGNDAAADLTSFEFPDGSQRSYRNGVYDSPFWVVNNNPFRDEVNRVFGFASADYKVLDWLSVSYKIGLDTYAERVNSAFNIGSATQPSGSVNQFIRSSTDYNSDFLIKINRNISSDITMNAVLGHNFFSTRVYTQQATGTTLSVPKFYHISNASTPLGFEGVNRRKLMGVFGQVNLAWRDQVFLNVSARNDWSSVLPNKKGANDVLYPAVSLGWDFTETFGLSNGSILSYGKVRASYGQVGNDGGIGFTFLTDPYYSVATWGGDGFISSGGQFPAAFGNAFDRNGTLPNGLLKPELTTTTEVGGEFKFFSGRLGFDVTYYNSLTTDAIIAVPIAPSSGYNQAIQNAAEISNKGIELVATGTPIKSGDFSWDISVNFTKYENIVEKLAPGVETISLAGFVSTTSRAVAGQPYGALFGASFLRNDAGQLVIDENGWPEQDPVEGAIGNPNPDWLAGVRNTLTYKGFSFGMLWDIRSGGDMWNGTYGILKTFGVHKVTESQREVKGYVFDGVVNTGTAEAPVYVANTTAVDFYNPRFPISQNKWNRYAFGGLPEENMQDTSWLRLREVSLGYALPKSMLSNIGFNNLSITLTGRNLLLFTEYNGIDPETNLTGASNGIGLDYFNNPNTKSYAITLNASF